MVTLITLLTTGKGSWAYLNRLLSVAEWSKVIVLANDFGMGFKSEKVKLEMVKIDPDLDVVKLKTAIKQSLKGVHDFEVAVDFNSGTGKEHSALLSALLALGLGVQIVCLEDDKLVDLTKEIDVPKEEPNNDW